MISKSALTSDTTMAYFDPSKDTEIFVDGSPTGLAAALIQKAPGTKDTDRKVIAYASRALTDVESRYSQTEREALSVYWAIKHFHLYLYGAHFIVVTDHKPLEGIFNKPHSKPPARIERWTLGLQQYRFKTRYELGKFNPADYMSRHALSTGHTSNAADEYVNYVIENAAPKSVTLEEIKAETVKDKTLQNVAKAVRSGLWNTTDETLKPFAFVKAELTVDDSDLILRGSRIIIPEALQTRVLTLAHEGHQGIVRTKALLREKVWFHNIDKKAESMVKSCLACQATTVEPQPYVPIKTCATPEQPWTHLSADFYGPINNAYLLVIVDEHSRFPVVEMCSSTSADVVIPILDRIFAMLGTPQVLKTDNGPPWSSRYMTQFATYLGFTHRRVTPLWPQANSESERVMKVIWKTVQTAKINGHPMNQALTSMLRNYRVTPHTTTGIVPATLLFGRTLKVRIPERQISSIPNESVTHSQIKKDRMNEYVSCQRRTRDRSLRVGDLVLVKQQRISKSTSPYEPTPYIIISQKGTLISARSTKDSRVITRNISFFKQVSPDITSNHQSTLPPLEDDDVLGGAADPTVEEQQPRRNPIRFRLPPVRYR